MWIFFYYFSWYTHHRKWVGASNRGNEVGPTHLPHPIEPRNNPEIVVWHSDSSAQLADSLMCRQKVPSSIPVGGNSKKSWSSFRKMHARNRTESRLRPQKSPLDLPTYPLMRVPASKGLCNRLQTQKKNYTWSWELFPSDSTQYGKINRR